MSAAFSSAEHFGCSICPETIFVLGKMKRKNDKESVSQKSAAEFFSEHQQIAGFDNPGKSLFTTIREFVENSLDGQCS